MNSENSPKVSEMSDVTVAKGLIADTFDLRPGNRSIVIGLATVALKRVERAIDPNVLRLRPRLWTERRVRSIVDDEARRIDAYEIEDLKKVALAEARLEFQRSTERAQRLAAFLAHQDPDSHRPAIEAQAALACGLGGAGDHVANEGPSGRGSRDDRHGKRPGGMARPRNLGARR